MKSLGEYLHKLGFKYGIYTDRGSRWTWHDVALSKPNWEPNWNPFVPTLAYSTMNTSIWHSQRKHGNVWRSRPSWYSHGVLHDWLYVTVYSRYKPQYTGTITGWPRVLIDSDRPSVKSTIPGLKTCASRPASLGFEAQDGRRIMVLQGRFIRDAGDSGFWRIQLFIFFGVCVCVCSVGDLWICLVWFRMFDFLIDPWRDWWYICSILFCIEDS